MKLHKVPAKTLSMSDISFLGHVFIITYVPFLGVKENNGDSEKKIYLDNFFNSLFRLYLYNTKIRGVKIARMNYFGRI